MPTPKAVKVIEDYSFHNRIIHHFIDGITHKESILQLPFEHNCMNWILGHIATNRSHILETLGADHAWQAEVRVLYHQDTQPIKPESHSIQFEILVGYLDESLNLLQAALENVSEEWLEENHTNYRGEKSRHFHVTSFHWHESFHLGQLEILKAFIESQR